MLEEKSILLCLGTAVMAVAFRRSRPSQSTRPSLSDTDAFPQPDAVKGYGSVDENGPAILEWDEEALMQPVFLTKSRPSHKHRFSSG